MTRRLKYTIAVALGVAIALTLAWWDWSRGNVVAASSSPLSAGPTIKVRSIPSSSHPLRMLVPASRYYRCEYFVSTSRPHLSSQWYAEDSYIAQSIDIQWNGQSDVTVLFDGRPTLRCVDGRWSFVLE